MKKNNEDYELLVVAEVTNLSDKEKFEKHLKKEGFWEIENEPFAYSAKSSTPIFHTRAYIYEVFSKALQKTTSDNCNLIIQLGENPVEGCCYDYELKTFREVKL